MIKIPSMPVVKLPSSETTGIIVCNPHSPNQKLRDFLREIETQETFMKNPRFVSILLTDATRQNAINKLVGMEGGDIAIKAHMDCIVNALDEVTKSFAKRGIDIQGRAFRVSKTSDEGVLTFLSHNYEGLQNIKSMFTEAYTAIRKKLNLEDYKYIIGVKDPRAGSEYSSTTSLKKLAAMMRHPFIIAGCSTLMSQPATLHLGNESTLNELIANTADSEIDRSRFPSELKIPGMAEVDSKFKSTFYEGDQTQSFEGGKMFSISFTFNDKDGMISQVVRNIVEEKRKCWGDYYFENFGMSMLNLVFGKAGANTILSAVSSAMYELSQTKAVVAGNYLTFWCEDGSLEENELVNIVNKKLAAISTTLPLKCRAVGLDATGLQINKVRDAFAHQYNGLAARTLESLDFIVNFVENIHIRTQWEICAEIGLDSEMEKRIIQIGEITELRRTIRDARDLIGIVRSKELPDLDDFKKWMERNEDQIYEVCNRIRYKMASILATND